MAIEELVMARGRRNIYLLNWYTHQKPKNTVVSTNNQLNFSLFKRNEKIFEII